MANPDRLYQLHRLLDDARHPRGLPALAEALECSRPTVKRLLAYLRDHFSAPIEYDREQHGYRYARDSRFELPGLWFSESELHALLAAEQLLEQAEPGLLADRLRPLRARIQTLLGEGTPGTDLHQRVQLRRHGQRRSDSAIFHRIAEAVLRQRDLRFDYRGRVRNSAGTRHVAPCRLLHYRDNWYLLGWCLQQSGWRYFALERIAGPVCIEAAFSGPAEKPPANEGYGLLMGPAVDQAVLRFAANRARWIADETWHPQQQQRWLPDGRLQLSFPLGDQRELLLDVLRYGDEVEVLAPASLRQAVRDRLSAALAQYGVPQP